ncbi:MAG TPA: endolytic transglycosylase MltG [Tepidimicrobium sp.]|nr:endolytic transglycosylase MltG [Tepidimicrobium sp.]
MAETREVKEEKKIKAIYWLIPLAALMLISSIAAIYYVKAIEAVSAEDPQVVEVEIPAGSSSKRIASILKDEGLIKSELIFYIQIKKEGVAANLKAGMYSLDTGMDMNDIIKALTQGGRNKNVLNITIPEGYEMRQIADKLSKKGIVDKDKFLKLASNKEHFEDDYPFLKHLDDDHGLEGYLFPSTYEFHMDSTEDEVIRKMLDKFEEIYAEHIEENIDNMDLSLNELIILASIVEKEAKVDSERPMIAGVLYNRLDMDMLLQVDATVQYALEDRKERLLYKDLEVESPYNTYIHKGLPPTPIASPGEKSIIATMNPSDVDYLYYVLKKDNTGEHIFTKTYEEHLKAQSKN